MKKCLLWIAAAAVLLLNVIPAAAITDSEYDDLLSQQLVDIGADGLDTLPDEQTQELLEQLGLENFDPESVLSATPEGFLEIALGLARKSYPAPLAAFLSLGAVLIVCQVLSAVNNSQSLTFNTAYEWFAGVAGALVLLTPLVPVINGASDSIRTAADFMTGFVPVFCAAVSAAGEPATAVLTSATLLLVSEAAVQLVVNYVVPLCGVFLAFGVVGGMVKSFELERLSGFARNVAVWGLGAVTTLFVGFLSLKSLVASAGDSLALRTVKMFVSGGVPIVGSGLSEAVGTVFSGMKLIKSAVGLYGILAAAVCVLPSLVTFLLWKLCVSLSGFFAAASGQESLGKLCKAVGDMLTVLLAVFALLCVCFILCVTAVLRTLG